VGAIALHRGLYVRTRRAEHRPGLRHADCSPHGWQIRRTAGPVWLFELRRARIATKRVEAARSGAVFCQGWFAETAARGRYMSETHAPFWILWQWDCDSDLGPPAT